MAGIQHEATRRQVGVLVGVCYVALRVAMVVGLPSKTFVDTESYRDLSFTGSATRLWGYPIVMAVLGDGMVVVMQTIVSCAAFLFLAWSLASRMTTDVGRWVAAVGVLVIGLHPRFTGWDLAILTESFAVSATVTLIALAAKIGDRRFAWVFVAVFAWWMFLRDGHLYLGIPIACAVGWRWRTDRTMVAVLAVVVVWAGVASMNDRWVENANGAANTIIIIPNNGDADWLFEHGSPPFNFEAYGDSWARFADYLEGPERREWVGDNGARLWAEYLLTHPGYTIGALGDWETLDAPTPPYVEPRHASVDGLLNRWTALLLAVGAVVSWRIVGWRNGALPGVLLLSTIPHQLLTYHGSPIEHRRHGVILLLVLVVACWWLIAAAVDGMVRRSDVPLARQVGAERCPVVAGQVGVERHDLGDATHETTR